MNSDKNDKTSGWHSIKQSISDITLKADQFVKDSKDLLSLSDSESNSEESNSLWKQIEQYMKEALPDFHDLSEKAQEITHNLLQIKNHFKSSWESVSENVENSGRYFDALQAILTLVGRYQIFKLKAATLTEEERNKHEAELHQKNAEELVNLCKKRGGAWVKAAQFISCHSSGLPQIYGDTFSSLQDQAEPIAWDQIQEVLIDELGPDWNKQFQSIDSTPLATASIGQVHKGQLVYGPTVALKIQIPGVQEVIKNDLKFFGTVAKLLGSQFTSIDLEQIVRELSKSILNELDYFHEARNLTQFYNHYENKRWEFPIIIKDLLTPRTLGMYFIEGQPIRQFLKEVPTAAEPVLKELVFSFLKQIFVSGLFHADPHPGNFFVTPQGKIALLDFGAVGQLNPKETVAYREVLIALLMEQFDKIDHLLSKAGFHSPHPEKLKEMLAQQKPRDFNELTKIQFFMEVMKQAEVKIPDKFVLMARVLVVIGGLARQNNVRFDLTELAFSIMS